MSATRCSLFAYGCLDSQGCRFCFLFTLFSRKKKYLYQQKHKELKIKKKEKNTPQEIMQKPASSSHPYFLFSFPFSLLFVGATRTLDTGLSTNALFLILLLSWRGASHLTTITTSTSSRHFLILFSGQTKNKTICDEIITYYVTKDYFASQTLFPCDKHNTTYT